VTHTSKTAKTIKRWYYSAAHWHLGDVMMGNIIFLWFLLFAMYESLQVLINVYINKFLKFILLLITLGVAKLRISFESLHNTASFESWSIVCNLTRCRAIAESTARCGCKFRYISKFSAASGGFHWDNNAFELNKSKNHGKIRVFNIIYLFL